MQELQFTRWKEFAVRMAEHCYPKATAARKEKILAAVKDYFFWREYQQDWKEYTDWDGNGDDCILSDDVDEFFDKYRHYSRKEECITGDFYNQVTCCIRAGFDVAVKQSGGVLGFTAGDIRKMWDGVVPEWIKDHWETPFDNIPDADEVWL